jgi:tetratricopeptide (TPR) repeat protein
VRYRLLESVRVFALDRLTEADLLGVARAAHANWFAEQADAARADQRGPRQGFHLAFVRIERANIDSALQWACDSDPLMGVRVAVGYGWTWVILGEAQVAADRLRAAVNASEGAIPLEDRAIVLSQIAWNEAGADLAQAEVTARAAIESASASGSASAIAESHFPLAFVMFQSGRAVQAIELMESWRRDALADATPSQVGISCMLLGYAGLAIGNAGIAERTAKEGAEILPSLGDDWLESHIESILGQLALGEGRIGDATAHLANAAQAARRSGLLATEAYHLVSLGRVQQLAGYLEGAIGTLVAAIASAQSVGLMRVVAIAQVQLGRVLIRVGRVDEAREVLTEVSRWFAASGGGEHAALADCLLATLPGGSAGQLTDMLDRARNGGDVEVQVLCLDALALRSAVAGDVSIAGALLAEADELAPSVAHRIAPVDRVDAEETRTMLMAADH